MQEQEPRHMTQPCLTLEETFKLLPRAAVPSSAITPKAQVIDHFSRTLAGPWICISLVANDLEPL